MTIELRGLISNLCVINNQLFMCNVVVSTIEPEGNISNDEDEALAHLTNDDELDKEDNIEGHALGGDLKVLAGTSIQQVVGGGTSSSRRRGRFPRKLKDMLPKARGAHDGPLRTPLHIGDRWQHQKGYEVEKVYCMVTLPCRRY